MDSTDDVLRAVIAAAPDALLAVDAAATIRMANEETERLFGWSREELVGLGFAELFPTELAAEAGEVLARLLADPRAPRGPAVALRARRRDGGEFPVEMSVRPVAAPGGTFVAVALRDVSAAWRAEQRLQAVLASAPDAILGVGATGAVALANVQAERLFGWTAEELLGQQVEVLVPDAVVGRHVLHRRDFLTDPRPRPMGAGLQLEARRKDGSTFPCEISLSAVPESTGEVMVLTAVRDVTARLEVEAERRRQELMVAQEQAHRLESLGQLAGGIAHDFNNLLGVILNYTTLLTTQVTQPQAAADLSEIRTAAERAAVLTRQLLAFARQDVSHPEVLEINDEVRSFAALLPRTLGDRICVRLELCPEPTRVTADRHQLEQLMLNVVLNARAAMPAGGALTLTTTVADGVHLTISDDGAGMSPEVLGRAFEPFFTTRPPGEGSGLGLAMVYGIVQQNRGTVTIASRPGEGTAVTVTLPHSSQAVDQARPEAPQGGRERILLVEDEAPLRVATARLLTSKGYDVVVATDGVDALEVFDREGSSIDLLLTDVVMPRMSGETLAQALMVRTQSLPMIFVSGYPGSRSEPLPGPLLAKPVVAEDLLRLIREALDG